MLRSGKLVSQVGGRGVSDESLPVPSGMRELAEKYGSQNESENHVGTCVMV